MGLLDAGVHGRLDRFIGYYEPYATSHQTLDADAAMQQEARNVGLALCRTIKALRAGELTSRMAPFQLPRPK